jgi:hypothetical protein
MIYIRSNDVIEVFPLSEYSNFLFLILAGKMPSLVFEFLNAIMNFFSFLFRQISSLIPSGYFFNVFGGSINLILSLAFNFKSDIMLSLIAFIY